MDNLNPPRVLIESNAVGLNESVRLDSLYSVTDLDLLSEVTEVQFRDNGEGGGYFTQAGRILTPTEGVWHTIDAGLVGTVQYVGGNSFGRESISVRVSDGLFRSNAAFGVITSGNSRPVVTATNAVLPANESINISDLVTFSDPENDPDRLYYVVDRKIGVNGGSLILPNEDDLAQPQANWLLVTGSELSDLRYDAPSVAGESETLSIRAFDGSSWSEVADFTITTSFMPQVIDNGVQELVTNERRSASELFSLDAATEALNPITDYLFVDRRINANGGYFEFKGERQESANFFRVRATELDQLIYVGASTGNDLERIGIVTYNGLEFGDVQDIEILTLPGPVITANSQTVRAGHFLNIATGGTANTSGTIPESDEPIFGFLDASGDAIKEFLFVDRLENGGHFVFKGAQVPSANWFRVPADELDQLEYVGAQTGPTSEQIGVMVNTNFVWNSLGEFTITTIPNTNAPVVTLPNTTARPGTVLPLESLFGWTDADGDNLESVSFFDGDAGGATGFFTVNGIRQAPETFVTVPFNQIDTVDYVTPSTAGSEEIQIIVNDGLLDSVTQTSTITAVGLPTIESNANDISVDTIERVLVSNIITQTDAGPALTRYQIFDENTDSRSARFELDGVDLQNGVVHDLTANQYNRLVFKGAEVDLGRQLDPIIVRGNNGITGWTEWERINVNTDPVGTEALQTGLAVTNASKGIVSNKTVVTYSFIDGGNQGGDNGNNGERLPGYYEEDSPQAAAAEQNTAKGLSQEMRAAYRDVLTHYEQVLNIEFVEQPFSLPTSAEMVIGAIPIDVSTGFLPSPDGNGQGNPGSDVWFDLADFDPDVATDVGLGSSFRDVTLGVVAFTLGQGTTDEADLPGTRILSIFNNFDYLSITSDQHDSVHNRFPEYESLPASLALYDIAHLQGIYGANTDFNSGDTQYGNFYSGAPNFIDNTTQVQSALWDGGGNDTLNYTLHVADETIDLREGTWSTINGVPQSLRISYNTVIENARGGTGDDNIRGNAVSNFLIGNDGNDVLRGDAGNDVLRGGAGDDTFVWSLGDGRDLIQELAAGGIDTLQVFDPSGSLSSVEDDFTFRRFGNDLRIDFTLNQAEGQGTVTIRDFGDEASRVEFLTIHNTSGTQIGDAVDLQSIFDQATTLAQRFSVGTELATTIESEPGAVNENAFIGIAVG